MSEIVKVDGTEYEVIAEQMDGGGDYEWGMAALIRRGDGQLFVATDGGCSCYGPWDGPELESVPTWQAAIDWLKGNPAPLFSDDDTAALAQQLMELRPEPSPR